MSFTRQDVYEAIKQILAEKPEKWFSPHDIRDALKQRLKGYNANNWGTQLNRVNANGKADRKFREGVPFFRNAS